MLWGETQTHSLEVHPAFPARGGENKSSPVKVAFMYFSAGASALVYSFTKHNDFIILANNRLL